MMLFSLSTGVLRSGAGQPWQGNRGSRWRFLLFVAATVTLSACGEEQHAESPTATQSAAIVATDEALELERFMALERVFAHVWNQVPDFSGFWYDETGQLVIGVTSEASTADVVAVLESIGGGYLLDSRGARRAVQAVQTALDFKTMIDWKHQTRAYFFLPGFHSLDYAESRNQIVAKVENEGQRESVTTALRDIGVPDARFTVEVGPPAQSTATIEDRIRSVVGGLRISVGQDSVPCTLGFTATLDDGGGDIHGFVTNTHCTPIKAGLDGANVYQTAILPADLIGSEYKDPPPFSCSKTTDCRWADVAFFQFPDGFTEVREGTSADSTWTLGAIANIDENDPSCQPTNGDREKTIDSSDPHMEIFVATNSSFTDEWVEPPAKGDTVYHLGMKTGETKAPVFKTNTDIYSGTSGVTYLDQTKSRCDACGLVKVIAGAGDSGGPVFRLDDTLASDPCSDPIRLDGIRWGTNGFDNPNTEVWFSPVDNVKKDLAPSSGDTLIVRSPIF